VLVWLTRLWPSLVGLARVVQPDTILRWHRAGFRAYWRRKSRSRPGRPKVSRELRELIRQMSKENPLWGAPRIHGELLKLGFEVAESTVSKYMSKHRGPPSQTWRTFLRNHADTIAAIDLCVVPTVTFECLFAFLVVSHGRRQLLWFAVTRHPTAEWLAQQIVEAFPWNTAPRYLIRDNDGAYGQAFTNRVRAMGIRDRPIAPRSKPRNVSSARSRRSAKARRCFASNARSRKAKSVSRGSAQQSRQLQVAPVPTSRERIQQLFPWMKFGPLIANALVACLMNWCQCQPNKSLAD
jgi:hypothetical protein